MAESGEGKMERFDKLLMALEDAKRVIRDEIADKVPNRRTPHITDPPTSVVPNRRPPCSTSSRHAKRR